MKARLGLLGLGIAAAMAMSGPVQGFTLETACFEGGGDWMLPVKKRTEAGDIYQQQLHLTTSGRYIFQVFPAGAFTVKATLFARDGVQDDWINLVTAENQSNFVRDVVVGPAGGYVLLQMTKPAGVCDDCLMAFRMETQRCFEGQ